MEDLHNVDLSYFHSNITIKYLYDLRQFLYGNQKANSISFNLRIFHILKMSLSYNLLCKTNPLKQKKYLHCICNYYMHYEMILNFRFKVNINCHNLESLIERIIKTCNLEEYSTCKS